MEAKTSKADSEDDKTDSSIVIKKSSYFSSMSRGAAISPGSRDLLFSLTFMVDHLLRGLLVVTILYIAFFEEVFDLSFHQPS